MVRKATKKDLPEILTIYESARQYMKENGNPRQWGDELPLAETTVEDIENDSLYVIERDGQLCGVMEFHIGAEPYYEELAEGQWHYERDYATVHRIASNGRARGIFREFLAFGRTICPYIRIDTHLDNVVMQRLIEAEGFAYCGIFYSQPDRGWIAYDKLYE